MAMPLDERATSAGMLDPSSFVSEGRASPIDQSVYLRPTKRRLTTSGGNLTRELRPSAPGPPFLAERSAHVP
jgi:hypothetical protein